MVKKVGPYTLESKLGEGSYGTVYFGHDSQTGLPIAAKAISLENLKSRFLEQLESEISAMKRLDSPYIIKLYDVLKTSRNVYMIMEYCSGGDLDHYIKKSGPTPEHLARKWLSQTLEAFQCLKAFKIIHRDLKLANILLSQEDVERADVKLADFGFAKILNEATRAKTMLGTPLFMAPEIFNREEYAFSVDIWSLGVLAYELLVGIGPFQCKNIEELKVAQRAGVEFPVNTATSDLAKDLVRRMLAYNPANRPSLSDLQGHPFFTGSSVGITVGKTGGQSPELISTENQPETPTFPAGFDRNNDELGKIEQALNDNKPFEHIIESFLTVSPVIAEFLVGKLTVDLEEWTGRLEKGLASRLGCELQERIRMKKGKIRKWVGVLEEKKAKSSPDLSATTTFISESQVESEAERIWQATKASPDPFERAETALALVQVLTLIRSQAPIARELVEVGSPTLSR